MKLISVKLHQAFNPSTERQHVAIAVLGEDSDGTREQLSYEIICDENEQLAPSQVVRAFTELGMAIARTFKK